MTAGDPLKQIWPGAERPVIGVIHAPPLPGSSGFARDTQAIQDAVMADADALCRGGVDGLILENYGDAPFEPGPVPAHTVAHLTALAHAVRSRFDLPMGINVLRNDGEAALGIAQAVGAQFVRVNVLCGARLTDQGIVQGIAHRLMRLRATLGAQTIRVLADVDVKHSAPLAAQPIAVQVADTVQRGGADGVIVTGPATGAPVDQAHLRAVREAAGAAPVLIGSGTTSQNAASLGALADGFIVGTAFKTGDRVDTGKVAELVRAVRG